jgi:hypothetical protein
MFDGGDISMCMTLTCVYSISLYAYLSFRVKINGQCVRWIFDMSAVRVYIKNFESNAKEIYVYTVFKYRGKTVSHSRSKFK